MKRILLLLLVLFLVACQPKNTLNSGNENKWDLAPLLKYDGNLYAFHIKRKDWNKEVRDHIPENYKLDKKIESTVKGSEKPTKNNQSNFGIYEYTLKEIDGETVIFVKIDKDTWMLMKKD